MLEIFVIQIKSILNYHLKACPKKMSTNATCTMERKNREEKANQSDDIRMRYFCLLHLRRRYGSIFTKVTEVVR